MVTDDTPAPSETLFDVLAARARATPPDRLAIDIAGGLLIGAAALWARPAGWVALLAGAVCLCAYGGWAIAERRLESVAAPDMLEHEQAWRALRGSLAFVGLAGFGLLLFSGLGLALGTIIS